MNTDNHKSKLESSFSQNIILFIKQEVVFVIALLLAIISCFFIHPSAAYIEYIDFRVLALLFCLMAVVNGLSTLGVFHKLGILLLTKIHSTRTLYLALVYLCFFTSMLITNDVALLTFVPFTILVLTMAGKMKQLPFVVILETIAANLGSMLTPLGNPQNLYLYTISEMSLGTFILTLLPYSIVSFIALTGILVFRKSEPVEIDQSSYEFNNTSYKFHKGKFVLYMILFVLCLLVVLHIIPFYIMLGIVLLSILIFDRRTLTRVDYILLLTFVWFFIFIGNMKQLPAVHDLLARLITGREFISGVIASQGISNVPAAILLSGFTDSIPPLLIGVNVGGLGTLIASLASLISYKLYSKTADSNTFRYLLSFTAYNIVFLIILILLYFCIK